MAGCEVTISLSSVVPERGLPIIKTGGFIREDSKSYRQRVVARGTSYKQEGGLPEEAFEEFSFHERRNRVFFNRDGR
jgi:hypothetical protein